MTLDVASAQVFTDSELLLLYRRALASLATSQSYSSNGVTLTRAQLPEIRETITWLEQRINSAAGNGGTALVEYGHS